MTAAEALRTAARIRRLLAAMGAALVVTLLLVGWLFVARTGDADAARRREAVARIDEERRSGQVGALAAQLESLGVQPVVSPVERAGPPQVAAAAGRDGRDAVFVPSPPPLPGRDGRDGISEPGPIGGMGVPGGAGRDGANGKDGSDGRDGVDGATGATGATGPPPSVVFCGPPPLIPDGRPLTCTATTTTTTPAARR